MVRRFLTARVALVAVTGVVWLAPVAVAGQTVTSSFVPGADASTDSGQAQAAAWTLPRTPWGAPDLQGVWDYATLAPLQRPRELTGTSLDVDPPDGRIPPPPVRALSHARCAANEYACHEGNYDLANILRTQRAEEQAAANAARPHGGRLTGQPNASQRGDA